jgi:NAD(P)-dependent dehydrogenase (short-subunit alcohol dehydrogenase family)
LSRVCPVHRPLDAALDLAVAPGYSAIGYRLRGLARHDAVAGSLTGRVAVVTGATSGIGEAAAEGLARAGGRVHLVVRDRERGERVRARIQERLPAPADLRLLLCDLADLDAVAAAAAELRTTEPDLAVLVNNAGVLLEQRERSATGIELTFATNVLGPFALTELLLPALRANAPGRVITVSSGGMYTARLHGEDLQLDDREFDGPVFYAHTKRAEVVLTELWSAHESEGVLFASMHPGWADTAGLRRSLPRFARLARPILRDEHQGADTIVWLATAPADEVPEGRLWHDRRPRPTHRLPGTRESQEDRRALWQACRRLTAGAAAR